MTSNRSSIWSNPAKFGKLLGIVVGFIVLVFVLKGFIGLGKPAKVNTAVKEDAPVDAVSGDTSNETLKALSAQIQAVSDQNKIILTRDNKLEKEAKQNVDTLQQQIQNRIQSVNAQNLHDAQASTKAIIPASKNDINNSPYPVGAGDSVNTMPAVDGIHLTWVDDMQSGFLPAKGSPNNIVNEQAPTTLFTPPLPNPGKLDNNKSVPSYTIPANSTLFDSTAWTGLIGRIPINGIVRDPYPFKILIGHKDLAANGIYIPDIQGIVVAGFATGDMALSCVRGNITSLTFVFQDGRISTTGAGNQSGGSSSSNTTSLGYLSTRTGNPCITGHFYTNAPTYLTGNVLLGAAQGAAGAYSASQTTSSTTPLGGSTSTVTGSPNKYVLGQAGVGAASQVQQWWAQREQNSFDAVYVAPNQPVVANITQEISIDYNPMGRKVAYDNSTSSVSTPALD
jgi:hypothetical protein